MTVDEQVERLRTEAHKSRTFVGLDRLASWNEKYIRRAGRNMDEAANTIESLVKQAEGYKLLAEAREGLLRAYRLGHQPTEATWKKFDKANKLLEEE